VTTKVLYVVHAYLEPGESNAPTTSDDQRAFSRNQVSQYVSGYVEMCPNQKGGQNLNEKKDEAAR
jgi:hypothetical protein